MTDAGRGRWGAYIRDIADRMGLRDWTIRMPGGPPCGRADASTWLCYGRKVAEIHLPDSFLHEAPEEQRDIVVHELVHLHFAAMDGLAGDWLDEGQRKAYSRLFEYGIDAMAAALAPHLPLPLWTINREETTAMGRQQPKPAETVKPKPKPRPKGTKPAK